MNAPGCLGGRGAVMKEAVTLFDGYEEGWQWQRLYLYGSEEEWRWQRFTGYS